MKSKWVLLVIIISSHSHYCQNSKVEIERLPGQPPVKFRQFSGYVRVDNKSERALFYYFVEAEADPQTKPVVLWLNGGPGCSSVGEGAFVEHGPFRPITTAQLIRNKYSWNREANMLYVETPAGVGFSYSTNTTYYDLVDDDMTARDNLIFLQRWFDKFPEYKERDLFLAGESYAGHYIPQFARLVMRSAATAFKLKGVAIGNPLLDFDTDFNSVAEYFWSHGVISDSSYRLMKENCSYARYRREHQILKSVSHTCRQVIGEVSKEVGVVDPYDVLLDLCANSSYESSLNSLIHPISENHRLLLSVLSRLNRVKENENGLDVCIEDKVEGYLNLKNVQKALHARVGAGVNWSLCSDVIKYNMSELEEPTIGIVGELVRQGLRVLVYSGDQDTTIPLLGTRTLVRSLANTLELEIKVSYRPWLYGKGVGGWTELYGPHNNLTFATIRGASHKAPFTQPASSFHLFSTFVRGIPLVSSVV